MSKRKTTEQFKQEVYNLVGDEYDVLEEYKNAKTKILLRHNVCGFEHMVTPNSFNLGNRCPRCAGNARKDTNSFRQEVYNLVGCEYDVMGDYVNATTKILVRHNKCGFEYEVTPHNFLRGSRCPECHGSRRRTTKQLKQEVYNLVGDEYTVLGEYNGANKNILMKHKICGREYSVRASAFLRGVRCSSCQKEVAVIKQSKSHKQFVQEVHDLTGDEYTVLGEYRNNKMKILILHNICGLKYNVSPHVFLTGSRCPRCNRSKGELLIEKILKESCVSYAAEYSFPGSRYRYDFAVFGSSDGHGCPDSHEQPGSHINSIDTSQSAHKARRDDKPVLLIEFDGIQHFEPVETFGGIDGLKETQKRDRAKNRLAEKHHVPLLRIRYDQFNLTSKKDVDDLRELLIKNQHLLSTLG